MSFSFLIILKKILIRENLKMNIKNIHIGIITSGTYKMNIEVYITYTVFFYFL